MMRLFAWLLATVLLFSGIDAALAATSVAVADTPATTATGATFTQPKGWALDAQGTVRRLTPPEPDTVVVVVDVADAADAKSAVARAWSLYRPEAHPAFKLLTARAAHDGWTERQHVDYETSPAEKAVIDATAYRVGKTWTVVLIDGHEGTVDKRWAAISLVLQSLRPAGYTPETFAGRKPNPLTPDRVALMKSFIADSIRALGVPGAGLALIDHGQVVYVGGLGVKELGKPDPVDADTLFMIASNTKGMTTLLLAELVDQRKLNWDQPVTQVYPGFRLGSAQTTSKVLVRHLVCACTGLPRSDLAWILSTRRDTPASVTFDQLAATQPTSGFGEVYQYNNQMASAAGYIAGHLTFPGMELGAAYDRAMQTQIFDPLGMTTATFSMEKALAGNHASAHGLDIDGKPAIGGMDFNWVITPYRPAGAAWVSARDLARYVQNELSLGVLPDGRRLVSEKNLLARRALGVPSGEKLYYGMGLETSQVWGVDYIYHGGSMAGFKSDWVAIPSAGVGAVLLTNSEEGNKLLRPFARRLLEIVYDGKPEAEADVAAAAARAQAELAAERPRLQTPAAPAAVAALAAKYSNPVLGDLIVSRSQGLVFSFGLWSSPVASRRNDDGSLSFVTIDPTRNGLEFVVGTRDGKPVLVTRDDQHEYVYTPVP